jgi:hypothetical protein
LRDVSKKANWGHVKGLNVRREGKRRKGWIYFYSSLEKFNLLVKILRSGVTQVGNPPHCFLSELILVVG